MTKGSARWGGCLTISYEWLGKGDDWKLFCLCWLLAVIRVNKQMCKSPSTQGQCTLVTSRLRRTAIGYSRNASKVPLALCGWNLILLNVFITLQHFVQPFFIYIFSSLCLHYLTNFPNLFSWSADAGLLTADYSFIYVRRCPYVSQLYCTMYLSCRC